ncbi:MAG TPA: hypothetical protein VF332_07050 [Vicinamibacterales bacterium]
MASPLSLTRIWRILKEVDLAAIRREAERRVHVLIIGEDTTDADALAVLLAEGQADPTPWLTAIDAPLAAREPGRTRSGGLEAIVDGPDVVLAVTRGRELSADMSSSRQQWMARNVPVVTVALAGGEGDGTVHAHGGAARVAIDRLDEAGFHLVVDALFSVVEPDRRLGLARQFPALRPKVFNTLIDDTARTNAGYAFSTGVAEIVPILDIPLNIGDILVLTKNQLMMSYRIALAAGKTGQPRELIGEIVGVLGGGLLFRQVARQLIGLIPVIGIVPKVAIAYGGTWAIGRAVVLWATDGRQVTAARLKQLSREGLARGRKVAKSMRRGTEL